jgi:hypothetical protein
LSLAHLISPSSMGVCFHKLLASVPISRYELLVVELASESPAAQSHVHSIEGHFLSYHVGASFLSHERCGKQQQPKDFQPFRQSRPKHCGKQCQRPRGKATVLHCVLRTDRQAATTSPLLARRAMYSTYTPFPAPIASVNFRNTPL